MVGALHVDGEVDRPGAEVPLLVLLGEDRHQQALDLLGGHRGHLHELERALDADAGGLVALEVDVGPADLAGGPQETHQRDFRAGLLADVGDGCLVAHG
jgi:hypothetical protein